MGSIGQFLSEFVQNFLSFLLMIVFGIVSFFFTVFIVDFGASMAGFPQDQYAVLSSAILVSAAILAGGISPLSHIKVKPPEDDESSTS